MTYPSELKESTNLSDNLYPVNLFHNVCPSGEIGRTALYMHWHDHFEIIYMTSGEASFHIDQKRYDASPGDLLIVPGGGLHVGYASTREQVEYWSLVFNRSLLVSPVQDPVHDHYLKPYLEGHLQFPVKLEGHHADVERIHQLMRSIIDEYERKEPAYELVIKSKVHLIFTLLSRIHGPAQREESAQQTYRRMDRIKEALLYIQNHYDQKMTLTEAAQMVNLTPYHFCHVFKAATGRTFVEYVNRYRMDIAHQLLQEGMTVTEAAQKVGCGNLNYFTKLFKKIKGFTPSEAKKRSEKRANRNQG